MERFQGIDINQLERVNPDDPRGPVYEWCKGVAGQQVSIYHRPGGTPFGNHFHKGDDPAKNPERFFLVKGRVHLRATNPEGQELDVNVDEGSEIIIQPGVLYFFTPLTDIIFLEYRTTVFNRERPDSYPPEEYDEFVKGVQ